MAAVFAYGLSVVDMAIILGPSNPPTLAVLVWHWLSDAAPLTQALGSAAAIAMFSILLLIVAISRILWRLSAKSLGYPAVSALRSIHRAQAKQRPLDLAAPRADGLLCTRHAAALVGRRKLVFPRPLAWQP